MGFFFIDYLKSSFFSLHMQSSTSNMQLVLFLKGFLEATTLFIQANFFSSWNISLDILKMSMGWTEGHEIEMVFHCLGLFTLKIYSTSEDINTNIITYFEKTRMHLKGQLGVSGISSPVFGVAPTLLISDERKVLNFLPTANR